MNNSMDINVAEKRDFEVFLFIDALGWDIVSSCNYLEKEFPNRRQVDMQFGYSCAAIPTILSGATPAQHGHLSLFRFAPKESPFRSLKILEHLLQPKSFWKRGRIRHILSKLVKKLYGFTGYFQLYQVPFGKLALMDYCEKKNLFIPEGMAPVQNLADMLKKSGLSHHISDWHLNDEENLAIAKKAIDNGDKFVFIYTAGLDAIRHDHKLDSEPVKMKLAWYEEKIKSLLDSCKKRGGNWRFTIFSDHGMTPLDRVVDLQAAIQSTNLVFGKDYGACYDSTLLRVYFISPHAKEKILNAIAPFGNQGHWLSVEEEKKYGIYREDRQFGDMIFLTNPGIQIIPSDMGLKPMNGMHGFAPEDWHSQAAVISTEPLPQRLQHVADYFPMMEKAVINMAR